MPIHTPRKRALRAKAATATGRKVPTGLNAAQLKSFVKSKGRKKTVSGLARNAAASNKARRARRKK